MPGRQRRYTAAARLVNDFGKYSTAACLVVLVGALGLSLACRSASEPLPCTATVEGRCWVYLGPQNVTVLAVAEVDEEIWIGTVGGGILRYDASDRTWSRLAFPARTVGSIAVVESEDTVWAAVNGSASSDTTCSYLYVSMDHGRTWQPRDGGLAAEQHCQGSVSAFAADPSDSERLLLANPRGVVLSEDGGLTWEKVLGPTDTTVTTSLAFDALAVSPADGMRVWAGGTNLMFGEQFGSRSDDGGHTWTATVQPGPGRRGTVAALLPHSQEPDVVLASIWGSVYRGGYGGATWQSVLELVHPGRYVHAFAVTDTMLFAVSFEETADAVDGTLGVYAAPALEGPWTVVPTPPSATGGFTVVVDSEGQVAIGTVQGVWLIRN